MRLLAPALSEAHYRSLWWAYVSLWRQGAKEVFSRIRLESLDSRRAARS